MAGINKTICPFLQEPFCPVTPAPSWDKLSSMKKPLDEFTLAFIARTKEARIAAKLTQDQVAAVLGIDQPTYKWYEKRTPLPHRYVDAFCTVTRVSAEWLFTGRRSRRTQTPDKSSDVA